MNTLRFVVQAALCVTMIWLIGTGGVAVLILALMKEWLIVAILACATAATCVLFNTLRRGCHPLLGHPNRPRTLMSCSRSVSGRSPSGRPRFGNTCSRSWTGTPMFTFVRRCGHRDGGVAPRESQPWRHRCRQEAPGSPSRRAPGLAGLDDVLRAAHRARGVERQDLADDEPIEEHPQRGEVLLDVDRDDHGLDLVEREASALAPGGETAHGCEVREARVGISDVGGEELPEAVGTSGVFHGSYDPEPLDVGA